MNAPQAFELADIYVRFSTGAYVTGTVRGKRGSSTMSAAAAAQRLAEKLFGARLVEVESMGYADITRIERFQARARPA